VRRIVEVADNLRRWAPVHDWQSDRSEWVAGSWLVSDKAPRSTEQLSSYMRAMRSAVDNRTSLAGSSHLELRGRRPSRIQQNARPSPALLPACR